MVAQLDTITTNLVASRLEAVLKSKFDPKEFRLSESGACPRKRVARVLGLPADANTTEDAEYFERGHVNEQWIVQMYREEFPRRCRTQVEVRTPFGDTGHMDITFPAERRVIEVKSVSLGAKELPRPEHVKQLQAYLHFWVDSKGNRKADSGELVYVRWGAGLKVEAYPVLYDPDMGKTIEDDLRLLHTYAEREELPAIPDGYRPERYPCAWRNKAGEVKCPYWETCWQDVATAPAVDAPEVASDLERYFDLQQTLRTLKNSAEEVDGAIDLIRQRLSVVLDAHKADSAKAGRYTVKRTAIPGRTTYDIPAALKANAVTPEMLASFTKVAEGYERWSIKREVQG